MSDAALVRPMTDQEYAQWRDAELASYAQEMVDSGMLAPEAAQARSAEQHAEFLPRGQATAGMHLLRVLDGDRRPVGVLWVGPHPRKDGAGFVYDVAIDEDRRGEGLGRGAMLAAEQIGREEGWSEIGLNVFGPNTRARTLYESLGYLVVNMTLAKPLT
ncbi:N-acetyltransferase family protein [Amnibacterium kyonggiense]